MRHGYDSESSGVGTWGGILGTLSNQTDLQVALDAKVGGTTGLGDLTTAEITQLKSIDSTTITSTQWGYIGDLDQGLAISDNVVFNELETLTAKVGSSGNLSTIYRNWSFPHLVLSSSDTIESGGSVPDPVDVHILPDQTKVYLAGWDPFDLPNAYISEFNLTVAGDFSTAVLVARFNVGPTVIPVSFDFNADYTKMYVLDSTTDTVYQYTLSTPYSVASATSTKSFSVSSKDTSPVAITFNSDTSSFYTLGNATDSIYQWDITSEDIDTASYIGSVSVASESGDVRDIALHPDDNALYYAGGSAVYVYDLSTSSLISSATYDSSKTFTLSNIGAMTFNTTGTEAYFYTGGFPLSTYTFGLLIDSGLSVTDLKVGLDSGVALLTNGDMSVLTTGLEGLTSVEVTQLANINSETISNTQWSYLGGLDQALTTSSPVVFDSLGIRKTSPNSKLHVYEDTTATDSPAGITIEQDGTGDAVLHYSLSGSQAWSTGIDNSDGDKYKIGAGLSVSTGTAVTIDPSNKYVGIGISYPSSLVHVSGTAMSTSIETELVTVWDRKSTPAVRNTTSAGLKVGSFEAGINGRGRLDIAVSGTTGAGNGYGAIPDVTVMTLNGDGNVGIGTTSPQAALDVSDATSGFLPPRMTTTQRNAMTAIAGMLIYNTTTSQHQGYNGSSWKSF